MGTFSQSSNQIDPGFGMNTSSQPSQGKGSTTMSSTSGQPQFGAPNQYSNTIQQNNGGWDNATIGNQSMGQGKGSGGKGQQQWQPFNQQWSNTNSGTTQSTTSNEPKKITSAYDLANVMVDASKTGNFSMFSRQGR